jgi:hypothetical protein
MKQTLLILFVLFLPFCLEAQSDTANLSLSSKQKSVSRDVSNVNISIYPVPVRDNNFTIKSDKEISSVKITNIIGQNIFRIKYSTPQLLSKITLDNPERGMYLVVIVFSDDTRIVKKVMVEGSN